MEVGKWVKYNNALISLYPLNRNNIDTQFLVQKLKEEKCLFARYTSDFDCGQITQWWYCVKDDKIDIDQLTSKQRYRIKKGIKNFYVKKINPKLYVEALFKIAIDSFAEYPKMYKPKLTLEKYIDEIYSWDDCDVFACFDRESNNIRGYAVCQKIEDFLNLLIVKVDPKYLNKEINAVLAFFICDKYLNQDTGVKYISDGERNIRHQTNYQDFLVKVLGFRYAYCKLNIIYSPWLRRCVNILYPFRSLIGGIASLHPILYNVKCVLDQEYIIRSFEND